MSTRLEDYALIGDCETAALVSRNGSIDWLCWPRFDSNACFAALLGEPEHGRWIIEPLDREARRQRRYRDGTLVLETRFDNTDGAATLIDFMPPRGSNSDVVRLVRGERGRMPLRMELILRFDYGRSVPWVNRLSDGTWRAIAGPDMAVLRTPVPLRGKDLTTVAEFDVAAGDTIPFVLTHGASHLEPPAAIDPIGALEETSAFWTKWSERGTRDGDWADAVTRSLVTLKALTYAPTGGIVAAPTTSLPEQIGGARTWDYRFCWLRDATLTLLALMNAGYYDEAGAWRDWLLRAAAGAPSQAQIMYGIAGERRLPEIELPWLTGYESSRPVRIGNAAHRQLQLDVFGEVMDVLHQAREGGLQSREDDWAFQRKPARAPRGDLARTGSGHVGNARRRPAFHLFESDGLGRTRPRHPQRRSAGDRWSAGSVARPTRAHSPGGLHARIRYRTPGVRAGVWVVRARRESAADADHRFPAALGPAHPQHHRGDRARARRRRLRAAL
jgi:GH15 family glucan-1,4-alpha-glucosidase